MCMRLVSCFLFLFFVMFVAWKRGFSLKICISSYNVQLKSILFNLLCVLIFFRNADSQLCFHFFFGSNQTSEKSLILYRYILYSAGIFSHLPQHTFKCSPQLPTSHCFRRRSAKKKKNGNKDDRPLNLRENSISEVYRNYNFPLRDSSMPGYAAKPGFMRMDPETDHVVRKFYAMDHSTVPPSRYSSWITGSRSHVAVVVKAVDPQSMGCRFEFWLMQWPPFPSPPSPGGAKISPAFQMRKNWGSLCCMCACNENPMAAEKKQKTLAKIVEISPQFVLGVNWAG